MSKQDRAYTRTASDLERKYNFGQTFAEVYGLVSDAQRAAEEAREAVDKLDETLSHEEIFNRLTNGGVIQGIYRGANNDIYINASYIQSGILAAKYIDADNLKVKAANITGTLTIGQLPDGVAQSGEIPTKVSSLVNDLGYQTETGVTTIIGGVVTTDYVNALGISVKAANITGTLAIGQLPDDIAKTGDIPTESDITTIVGGVVTTDYVNALGISVKAANIEGTLTADQIVLTGAIGFTDLSADVNNSINAIHQMAVNAHNSALTTSNQVSGWTYAGTTYIDGTQIMTGTVTASAIFGGVIGLINQAEALSGTLTLSAATSGAYAIDFQSYAAMRLFAQSGDMWLEANGVSEPFLWLRSTLANPVLECQGILRPTETGVYSLGSSGYAWSSVWALEGTIQTSDRNQKNSIVDIPEKYVDLFMNLKPRLYKYNNGTSDRYHVGYIAQEVEEAMNAAGVTAQEFAGLVIDTDEDGNQVYMLRYDEFMALHTMMIQRIIEER